MTPSSKTRGFATPLVVILLALFAGGILYFGYTKKPTAPDITQGQPTQTPERIENLNRFGATLDTDSWDTYRNADLGFEVKYPAGVSITERTTGEGELSLIRDYFPHPMAENKRETKVHQIYIHTHPSAAFSLTVYENATVEELFDYYSSQNSYGFNGWEDAIVGGGMIIDGITTKEVVVSTREVGVQRTLYWNHNGNLFIYAADNTGTDVNSKALNWGVLSTIDFF